MGILFGNKNMHILSVSLGGKQIQFVQTVQFLGLVLDKKLTFRQHINDLVTRCKKDYGAQIYASASISNLKKLDIILNTTFRLALGPFIPHQPGTWRWRPVYYHSIQDGKNRP